MDLDAPGGELVGDDLGGASLLEGGLGMAMDIAAARPVRRSGLMWLMPGD
jgi:hypothetical protein